MALQTTRGPSQNPKPPAHHASALMWVETMLNADRHAKLPGAAAALRATLMDLPSSLSCAATMLRSAGMHRPKHCRVCTPLASQISFLQAVLALHSRPAGHCAAATVGSQSITRALARAMAVALVEQKSTHVPIGTHASLPPEQVQRVLGLAMEHIGAPLLQSLSDAHVPGSKAAGDKDRGAQRKEADASSSSSTS